MKRLTFIILCLESAVLSFNIAASAALVPSIASEFALSQFLVGKMIWLFMLPYGIAALIYGPLVRVIDARKVELICLLAFSLANLLAAFSPDIFTLFAARLFMGLFGASVIPLGLILIARHLPYEKRGRYVGIFFGTMFFSSLSGLFLSGLLSWRLIFFIPAVVGLLATCAVYFYLPSFKGDTSDGGFQVRYLSCFKNKKISYIFTYIFVVSLLFHGVQQWLAVFFSKAHHLGQLVISSLITLTSLSGVFGELLGGFFSDLLGRIRTANVGIFLMTLGVFALILKLPIWILAIIMFIWGFGWTLNHAGVSTILTDLPEEFLNEAASLNSGVRFLSGGLGVAIGGVILQKSFNLGFILLGLSLIILRLFSRVLLADR